MSLNYFLQCQQKCEQISMHIDEIIFLYDELISESHEYYETNNKPINILCDVETLINEKNIYVNELEKLNDTKRKYIGIIKNICMHDFCKDEIDITPDKSKQIEYCLKCGYTKPN